MQNAKCKMQNECYFFAETKKLLNGIHRYLYNQKLIVPYGETSFSSKSIPSHSIELRFAKAKRLINFAFCILHFAFRAPPDKPKFILLQSSGMDSRD